MVVTATGHEVRPYTARDWTAVLALINGDRLPGQPVATVEMLVEAIRGHSDVDGGWWAELSGVQVDVLTDAEQTLLGVVSYATRPRDGAGAILWLHGRENPAVVEELLDHTLAPTHSLPDHRGILVRDGTWPRPGGIAGPPSPCD